MNKLEILQGGRHGGDNLIKQLASLSTTAGMKAISEMISMPTMNIDTIQKRQAVIQELVADDSLRTKALTAFAQMGRAESYLYDFYQKNGLTEAEKALYPGVLMRTLRMDEIPMLVSATNRLYATYPLFLQAWQTFALPLYLKHGLPAMLRMADTSESGKKEAEKMIEDTNNVRRGMGDGLGTIIGILSLPQTLAAAGSIKSGLAIIADFQQKLINVAAYVRSAQSSIKMFAANERIQAAMPELNKELKAYVNNTAGSKRFQKLIKLLNSSTFNGPIPSMTSSPGNILVAYKLMNEKETRTDFARLFDFVGQLDAYTALAQKIKDHESLDAKFSFVSFDQKNDTPFIKATDLWNPFVPAAQVVTNNFNLNTGNERDILLTGPNTSGKSTFIKALMISLIMAQSFGVAPASSMAITPFTKLLSYMSITDDVASGISQFKAEVIRANQLKNIVISLRPDEFAFFILDEIFTGTAPEQAEKLSYDFIRNLSNFSNVLFINATHFKGLTELEQSTNRVVKNYHLGAEVDDKGQVTKYTRRLVPGVAKYSSAAQVAREEGISDDWSKQ